MHRGTLLNALAVCSCLAVCAPLLAAEAPSGSTPAAGSTAATAKPAEPCLTNVRALRTKMSKQGYWIGSSDAGYGYPMGAFGYGYGYGTMTGGRPMDGTGSYAMARPGYEIRTLLASANILAWTGQEHSCESVLASADTLYTRYQSDLHDRGIPLADQDGWQQRQIAAARPVTGKAVSFRSDELLDADVVSPSNEALGSVYDLITNPQTGEIAYVVISRGGLFGIDASYTPVPWSDFKATPNGSLLVLDTTKAVVAAAPQGSEDQFSRSGAFETEGHKVDAYWTSHIKVASGAN